jgi:carboxylate-amine ligase
MAIQAPDFTLGVEEEYLLVDSETLNLVSAPSQFFEDCQQALGNQVSPEYLQCQIEIGTGVCANIAEARADLVRLRATIKEIADRYGILPLAVSCHPFADWTSQHHTRKERYDALQRDLAGVVRRLLICGMHVHVGIGDDDLRIDLMNQVAYFLPHLLALSTSSPYWQGRDTGLSSYRLTVFDNLPRTGLPPVFNSFSELERSVQVIIDSGLIEDSSKIWWDIRPSARFPTVETRICDVSPILDHTISITALLQSITAMLFDLRRKNQRWRQYDRFLIEENRWRAQRYGMQEGLIDFGAGRVKPYAQLLEELIEHVAPHAEQLGCLKEVEACRDIVETGSSAERQRGVYDASVSGGASHEDALKDVVRSIAAEFTQGI